MLLDLASWLWGWTGANERTGFGAGVQRFCSSNLLFFLYSKWLSVLFML